MLFIALIICSPMFRRFPLDFLLEGRPPHPRDCCVHARALQFDSPPADKVRFRKKSEMLFFIRSFDIVLKRFLTTHMTEAAPCPYNARIDI